MESIIKVDLYAKTQLRIPLSPLPPELNDGMLGLDGFFSGLSVAMIIADGRRFGHPLHQDIFTVEVSTFSCVSTPKLRRCSGWVVLWFSGTSVPTMNSGVGENQNAKKNDCKKSNRTTTLTIYSTYGKNVLVRWMPKAPPIRNDHGKISYGPCRNC